MADFDFIDLGHTEAVAEALVQQQQVQGLQAKYPAAAQVFAVDPAGWGIGPVQKFMLIGSVDSGLITDYNTAQKLGKEQIQKFFSAPGYADIGQANPNAWKWGIELPEKSWQDEAYDKFEEILEPSKLDAPVTVGISFSAANVESLALAFGVPVEMLTGEKPEPEPEPIPVPEGLDQEALEILGLAEPPELFRDDGPWG